MKQNKKIIVTIGVPASGKSTYANNLIQENPSFVKIERDDFRYSFKNIGFGDRKFEDFISEIHYKAIHTALNSKYNVIVSDTNCNLKYLKILLEEFKFKADIELKFFPIVIEEAYEMDALREKCVGKEVIDRMAKGYVQVYDEYSNNIHFPKQEFIYQETKWDALLRNAIVVDLDGTIAHSNGKRGYYEWAKVGQDDLDEDVGNLVCTYSGDGEHIIFLTGRSKECYGETYQWIQKSLGIEYFTLVMREANDFRPSTVVKKELYQNHVQGKYNVIFALDDKEDICNMWRSLGIKAFLTMEDK